MIHASTLASGPQYGTLERAWSALCTEAEKVSELHMEVKAALMGEDYEKLKNWQRDAYHKQMIGGFKETKEAEDGFRKAQKPWAKKLKEVRTFRMCSWPHLHKLCSQLLSPCLFLEVVNTSESIFSSVTTTNINFTLHFT